MAVSLVTFNKGKFELAVNTRTQANIISYIDRYQTLPLYELMGEELYDLYAASPTDPLYEVLSDPLIFQSKCGKVYESKGFDDMLAGIIFFYYTRDVCVRQTVGGAAEKKAENSTPMTGAQAMYWQRYNESIVSFDAIQAYIREHIEDYPTYNGVKLEPVIPYF